MRQRLRTGAKRLIDWPVTAEGWSDAWAYLLTRYPRVAASVRGAANAGARVCIEDAESHRAELAAHGKLDALPGCVLLGGYGYKPGFSSRRLS